MDKAVFKQQILAFLKGYSEVDIAEILDKEELDQALKASEHIDELMRNSRQPFRAYAFGSSPFIFFFFDYYKAGDPRIRPVDKADIERFYGSVEGIEYYDPYDVRLGYVDENDAICSLKRNRFWLVCDWLVTDSCLIIYFGPKMAAIHIPWPYINQMMWYQKERKRLFGKPQLISGFGYRESSYHNGIQYVGCRNEDYGFLMPLFKREIPDTLNRFDEALRGIQDELKPLISRREQKLQREEEERMEKARQELQKKNREILKDFDVDDDDFIDVVEYAVDFKDLLEAHQSALAQVDHELVHKLVKISLYLEQEQSNIYAFYRTIRKTKDHEELKVQAGVLKNKIFLYHSLLVNSFGLLVALIDNNMLTFYRILETFDRLNVLDTNWQKEVAQKLTNMEDGINDLVDAIYSMESSIIDEIRELNDTNLEAIGEMEESISSKLKDVASRVNLNNLISSIQLYYVYKWSNR